MATIIANKGRLSLMLIILVGMVAAIVYLFTVASGGAIGSKNLETSFLKYLGFYLPLLTLVATFYFKGPQANADNPTPTGTLFFAVGIVLLWVLVPVLLLLAGLLIEDVLDYLDKLIPLGQSLALMAIGYYFTKG